MAFGRAGQPAAGRTTKCTTTRQLAHVTRPRPGSCDPPPPSFRTGLWVLTSPPNRAMLAPCQGRANHPPCRLAFSSAWNYPPRSQGGRESRQSWNSLSAPSKVFGRTAQPAAGRTTKCTTARRLAHVARLRPAAAVRRCSPCGIGPQELEFRPSAGCSQIKGGGGGSRQSFRVQHRKAAVDAIQALQAPMLETGSDRRRPARGDPD